VPKKTIGARIALEDELTQLLEAEVPSARDRQLVRRVLGWDGKGGCPLKRAGDEAGITRERSRQIYDRAIEAIQSCELSSSLDDVLAFVSRTSNRDAGDVESDLQIGGLTRRRFELRALMKTARVFGRIPKFTAEASGGKLFAVASPGVVRAILKAAHRASTRYGIQTVSEMCGAIPGDRRRASDRTLVRQVLKTRDDIRWLDAREETFWLASVPRNPMILYLKKVLSFAAPVTISDLHRAIARLPGKRRAAVTRRQLVNFCSQVPFCRLSNGCVEPVGRLTATNLISKPERMICRILQRHGNELPIKRLRMLCTSAGVTAPNFWRIVLYSPLIYRRAPRIYRVVTAKSLASDDVKLRTA
jgi:hypothetical protein